jgi:hypothetical protein
LPLYCSAIYLVGAGIVVEGSLVGGNPDRAQTHHF